jgi:uncharacterized repeat protein (TIGR01451 family)
MRHRTLWSLCAALLAALVVTLGLAPSPAAQARPHQLVIDTPTGVPATATSVGATATGVPATATSVGATATSVGATATSTPVRPTGTASSPDSTATATPERVPAPGAPRLRISKSSSASEGVPGDFVTFTLTARNDGGSAAQNVTISDSVPGFLEIYNVKTTKGIASNSGQTVTVRLDSLEPGESVEVTILVRIRDDAQPQDGTNIGVVEEQGGERVTSERVRITVLLNTTATALAATGTPLAATPSVVPRALPATSQDSPDLESLILFFAVGLMILSIGWAVLGVRRR